MRILLDENLPRKLVNALRAEGHEVESVHTLRMQGLDNGALYQLACAKFDLCFTRGDYSVERGLPPHPSPLPQGEGEASAALGNVHGSVSIPRWATAVPSPLGLIFTHNLYAGHHRCRGPSSRGDRGRTTLLA